MSDVHLPEVCTFPQNDDENQEYNPDNNELTGAQLVLNGESSDWTVPKFRQKNDFCRRSPF